MSKRHFNSLAAAIRDWRRACPSVDEADVAQLVSRLASVCQAENPRFNRGRFFDACGLASTAGRKVALMTNLTKDRCIMLGCNRVARRNTGGYCKGCAEARRESLLREARTIVERGACPDCGTRLHRNLALAGWWQCGHFGSPGFQHEAGPACSFQTFTE